MSTSRVGVNAFTHHPMSEKCHPIYFLMPMSFLYVIKRNAIVYRQENSYLDSFFSTYCFQISF